MRRPLKNIILILNLALLFGLTISCDTGDIYAPVQEEQDSPAPKINEIELINDHKGIRIILFGKGFEHHRGDNYVLINENIKIRYYLYWSNIRIEFIPLKNIEINTVHVVVNGKSSNPVKLLRER